MSSYWTHRKKFIGARAFLPFNLSSEGALTCSEIRLISTGFAITIGDDSRGRPILFNDPSRQAVLSWPDKTPQEVDGIRVRSLFFVYSMVAMEHPKSRTKGVVCLRALNQVQFKVHLVQQQKRMLTETVPFKVHSMHFCLFPEKQMRNHFIKTTLPSFINLWGNMGIIHQFLVHVESTPDMMLKKLKPFGFEESKLPPRLGGSFGFEEFLSTWLNERGLRITTDLPQQAQGYRSAQVQEALSEEGKRPRLDPEVTEVEGELRKMAQLQWLRGVADKVAAAPDPQHVDEGLLGLDAAKALTLLECLARESSSTPDEVLDDPFSLEGFARLLESPQAPVEEDLERQLELALAERESLVSASERLSELSEDDGDRDLKHASLSAPSCSELERELQALEVEMASNRAILAGMTDPVDAAQSCAAATDVHGDSFLNASSGFDISDLQSLLRAVATDACADSLPWNLAQDLPRTLNAVFPARHKDLSESSEVELSEAYESLQRENRLIHEIGSLFHSSIAAS